MSDSQKSLVGGPGAQTLTSASRTHPSRRRFLALGAAGLLTATAARALGQAGSKGADHLSQPIRAAFAALDAEKLTRRALDFCDISNPLGHEETMARFFHQCLREAGLTSSLQPFAPDRSNVLAKLEGSGGGRSLLLTAHLENGFYDIGTPIPKARIVDGEWVSGSGIWNEKGALAAYVAAVTAVRKAGVKLAGDVIIAGVAGTHDQTVVESRLGSGVQGYSVGTTFLLDNGVTADLAVDGSEPTSFKLVRQHFGMAGIRIDVRVKQSTPAVIDDMNAIPWPPSDAVGRAANVVQAVQE